MDQVIDRGYKWGIDAGDLFPAYLRHRSAGSSAWAAASPGEPEGVKWARGEARGRVRQCDTLTHLLCSISKEFERDE